MFVGQIPRSMDENDLRKLFEEFGGVFQLNILRDKITGQSKGCCFVTFYTRKAALEAQNALHNIKTMPGMHHPVQMKPADSEKRNPVEERKLFVGMISKKCSENDIRMMFAPFGTIEDCTVLREPNGQSKGCAFVTYANRQSAQNCIKNMHQSQTMEGCSSPVVVNFADTPKEKEAKKIQQMSANLWNMSLGSLGPLAPQYLAFLQQAAASGNLGMFNNLGNMGLLAALAGLTSGALSANNSGLSGGTNSNMNSGISLWPLLSIPCSPHSAWIACCLVCSNSLGALAGLQSFGNNNLSSSMSQGMGGNMNGIGSGNPNNMDALSQAYSGIQQYAGLSALMQQNAANSPAGKQTEGPDGANLFIYHLPQEFSDQDLMQTFTPFGTVISAKVFIDKQTNLSKCFGFVSYDNPMSAQGAIQSMNGFQIALLKMRQDDMVASLCPCDVLVRLTSPCVVCL
ncbi:hypothetical protein ScPMuIL_012514 [Solemya velum]